MIFFEDVSTALTKAAIAGDDIETIRTHLKKVSFQKRQMLMRILCEHSEFAKSFAELIRKQHAFSKSPSQELSDEILRLERDTLEPLLTQI